MLNATKRHSSSQTRSQLPRILRTERISPTAPHPIEHPSSRHTRLPSIARIEILIKQRTIRAPRKPPLINRIRIEHIARLITLQPLALRIGLVRRRLGRGVEAAERGIVGSCEELAAEEVGGGLDDGLGGEVQGSGEFGHGDG